MSAREAFAVTVREADIGRTAKLVGFTLASYMTRDGEAGPRFYGPTKVELAAACGLGDPRFKGNTATDDAIDALEAAGLIRVVRDRGRLGYLYRAVVV